MHQDVSVGNWRPWKLLVLWAGVLSDWEMAQKVPQYGDTQPPE